MTGDEANRAGFDEEYIIHTTISNNTWNLPNKIVVKRGTAMHDFLWDHPEYEHDVVYVD
jgi:hypothetical protein